MPAFGVQLSVVALSGYITLPHTTDEQSNDGFLWP